MRVPGDLRDAREDELTPFAREASHKRADGRIPARQLIVTVSKDEASDEFADLGLELPVSLRFDRDAIHPLPGIARRAQGGRILCRWLSGASPVRVEWEGYGRRRRY